MADNREMLRRLRGDRLRAHTRAAQAASIEIEFPDRRDGGLRGARRERDHVAVIASLRPFFEPARCCGDRSIVRRGSIGGELFRNILESEFAGAAYPVNRDGTPVAGVHGLPLDRRDHRADRPGRHLPAGADVLDAAENGAATGCAAHSLSSRRDSPRSAAKGSSARSSCWHSCAPRGTADRAELPRHRDRRAEPERNVRAHGRSAAGTSASRRRAVRSGWPSSKQR